MKKSIVALLLILAMVGCKNKEKKTETMVDTPEETIVEVTSYNLEVGCYRYDSNGSKVVFEITRVNDSVMGQLDYSLKEKDTNTGTFSGILKDSVLLGSYTFMSEGMESSREVAFLLDDGQLIEGFGEMDDTGTAFEDKNSITFSSSMPLTKSKCD